MTEAPVRELGERGAFVQIIPSDWIVGRKLAVQYPDGSIRVLRALEEEGKRWLRSVDGDRIEFQADRHTVLGRVARIIHDYEE